MGKKIMTAGLALVLAFCFIGTAFAMEKGNKRKGKYTYRKLYKACYQRGEVKEAKPPVNPDAKTQDEWEAVFDNRQFEEFGCQEEWSNLSDKDVVDIFTYLQHRPSQFVALNQAVDALGRPFPPAPQIGTTDAARLCFQNQPIVRRHRVGHVSQFNLLWTH